jgi:hypothetical protein
LNLARGWPAAVRPPTPRCARGCQGLRELIVGFALEAPVSIKARLKNTKPQTGLPAPAARRCSSTLAPPGRGRPMTGQMRVGSAPANRTPNYALPSRLLRAVPSRAITKPLCVKWFGSSFLRLVSCAFAAVRRRGRGVGWAQVREWLRRRAGIRGESRPRWRQCRSPFALPGP